MKIVVLFLLPLISFQCYSQTKAETIDWITEKIKDYGNTDVQTILSIDYNGNITYSFYDYFLKDKKHISTFNLNDVIEAGSAPWMPDEKVTGFKFFLQTKKNKVSDNFMNKNTFGNIVVIIMDYNETVDKDLRNRLFNATIKLISYNKAELKPEPF